MAEKTYDVIDPRGLPYRFAYSSATDEVFIVAVGHIYNIIGYFENRFAFHRFMVEGNKVDDSIQEGVIKEAADMLKNKREEPLDDFLL